MKSVTKALLAFVTLLVVSVPAKAQIADPVHFSSKLNML